jgi:hypothetical protein
VLTNPTRLAVGRCLRGGTHTISISGIRPTLVSLFVGYHHMLNFVPSISIGIIPHSGGITTLCHVDHPATSFTAIGNDRLYLPPHSYYGGGDDNDGAPQPVGEVWHVDSHAARRHFQRNLPLGVLSRRGVEAVKIYRMQQPATHFVYGHVANNDLRLIDSTMTTGMCVRSSLLVICPPSVNTVPMPSPAIIGGELIASAEYDGFTPACRRDNWNSNQYTRNSFWCRHAILHGYPRGKRDIDMHIRTLQSLFAGTNGNGSNGSGNEWPRDLLIVVLTYLASFGEESQPPESYRGRTQYWD